MSNQPDQQPVTSNVITYGRALVTIVDGADQLYPDSQRLRELIAAVPVDIGAGILAASENIAGPVGDVSLN